MVKYTRTYEELPRGLSKMFKKIEPSIATSVKKHPRGRRTRYIVAYNGKDEPRGILEWSHRCARHFGRHNMPFLANMDTSVHHRGYGELLFNQFLSEIKYRFFLFCMDENAEQFWRHIGEKNGLTITTPFKSPWGTPALLMKKRKPL